MGTLALFAGCGYVRHPYAAAAPPPVSDLSFGYVVTSAFTGGVSQFQISSSGLWTSLTPATVSTGRIPFSLVVDHSGRFVYVANTGDNTVSEYIIDLATGRLSPIQPATLPTGDRPLGLAIDPLGRFLYTANFIDSTISMYRIDQTSGELTATVPASAPVPGTVSNFGGPVGLAVSPSGKFLFAASNYTVEAFAIDAATGLLSSVGSVLKIGALNESPAIDPTGTFLYIPSSFLNELEVLAIDPTSGALFPAVVPSVPAGAGVSSVALDPTGRFLYAVNRAGQSI